MSRLLWSALAIFAAVLLLSAPTPSWAQSVTFTQQAVQPGLDLEQRKAMTFDIAVKMTMGGGANMNADMQIAERATKRVQLLEIDDRGPTKMKVEYREVRSSQTLFGNQTEVTSPLEGQSFVLQRDGSTTTAEPAPPPDLQADVTAELGELDGMLSFVRSSEITTLSIGDSVDLTTLGQSALFGGSGPAGAKVESGKITLKKTRIVDGRPHGVFTVQMRMSGKDPSSGMDMTMEADGEVLVDTATGWTRSMTFSGPVTMKGSQNAEGVEMTMDGTGTFKITEEWVVTR